MVVLNALTNLPIPPQLVQTKFGRELQCIALLPLQHIVQSELQCIALFPCNISLISRQQYGGDRRCSDQCPETCICEAWIDRFTQEKDVHEIVKDSVILSQHLCTARWSQTQHLWEVKMSNGQTWQSSTAIAQMGAGKGRCNETLKASKTN